MIPASLTSEHVRLEGGGVAVRYRGTLVRDDAETALNVLSALSRGTTPHEVGEAVFPDPAGAFASCDYVEGAYVELVRDALWDVFGVDVDGSHADETGGDALWDPVEDASRIRATLRMAYGVDWDEERGTMPWSDFLALVGGAPLETPLGQAMHYRNPKTRPKPGKRGANREQVAAWDRASDFYRIRREPDSRTVARRDRALTDAFYSIAGGAANGR